MSSRTHVFATEARKLDAESARWIARLRADHPDHEAAVKDLHMLLLNAARFEVHRRRAAFEQTTGGDDREDLAQQSADDALMAVLSKLDDFRGESRFTTWAYKFALLEAAVKVRRRAWQNREVQIEPGAWSAIVDRVQTPHSDVETREIVRVLQQAIRDDLSEHQKDVLIAITMNDIPIDVLAERLHTTRGALYKTLHDARRKLRAVLAAQGMDVDRRLKGKAT